MNTEMKWGLIIAIAGFVWVCLEYAVGLHTRYIDLHPVLTLLWIPLAIVLLVLALREKKRAGGGQLAYWDGVKTTLLIAVILTVVSPLGQWVFFNFINPGFFETMIEHAVATAADRGQTPEEARTAAEGYFNFGSYLMQGATGGFIGTLVTGMIAMIFMRTKPAAEATA